MFTKKRIKKLNKIMSVISDNIECHNSYFGHEVLTHNSTELSKIKTLINKQKSINKKQYKHIYMSLIYLSLRSSLVNKKLFDLNCKNIYSELNDSRCDLDCENKSFILITLIGIKQHREAIDNLIERVNNSFDKEKNRLKTSLRIHYEEIVKEIVNFKKRINKIEHLKNYESAFEKIENAELYIQKVKPIIYEIINKTGN